MNCKTSAFAALLILPAVRFKLEPKFDTPTAYEKDVELALKELKDAAR